MIVSENSTFTEIRGGTNNPWAPPIDYVQEVLLPNLSKIGFKGYVELIKRGFYPKGGGIVKAFVEPTRKLSPVVLKEFGEVKRIYGLSYSSRLPKHIVERMAQSANLTITTKGFREADIKLECLSTNNRSTAISSGCGIILIAELSKGAILGSDSLGELAKSAEKVGQEAAETLCRQLNAGAPVDKHLEDQLIVYMTIANGRSEIKVEEVRHHILLVAYKSQRLLQVQILGYIKKKINFPALYAMALVRKCFRQPKLNRLP